MAKFSVSSKGSQTTTNKEGGKAFVMNAYDQLVQVTATNLMREPKFYGDVQPLMDSLVEQIAKEDPEFILRLADYCRNELYLRTVSVYLLTKAANMTQTKPYVHAYTPLILRRADEIYEALACHVQLFSGKTYVKGAAKGAKGHWRIPNSLKKGIKDTFKYFDEYQFGKYNRDTGIDFKWAILKTKPKEPSVIIKKILDDKLATPFTWETELSTKGNKVSTWNGLIDSGKLPYMAALRNLNSMLRTKNDKGEEVGIDAEHLKKVLDFISNPEMVKRSKQFPFRFYTAKAHVEAKDPFRTKEIVNALNKALEISVVNLPKLKGRTLTVADVSGSMRSGVSQNSEMTHEQIATLMVAMTSKFSENAIGGVFAEKFKMVPDMTGNILEDADKLKEIEVGGSTDGWTIIDYLNTHKVAVDRVLIFTDEEMYDSTGRGSLWYNARNHERSFNAEIEKYLKNVNPKARFYIINLNGYGDSCVNRNSPNVVTLAGWSDKILNFISFYEEAGKSFIEKIKSYKSSMPELKTSSQEE